MKGSILIELIIYIGLTAIISSALLLSSMQIGKGMWSVVHTIEQVI